jgi:4-hydroxy-3-polyprenylbenzoate decarboxylase
VTGSRVTPREYPDLQDHLAALERHGLLVRVDRPINKDTELHPLVRWQFRGLREEDRKAFLFSNVVDSAGRRYDIPVAVGVLSANRDIYRHAIGLEDLGQLHDLWNRATRGPIPPVEIPGSAAPVHEVVYEGEDLDVPGQGLEHLPIPISTPGWDNAPYVSASHYITRDPETGVYNVGTYRGMVKSNRRVGMNASTEMGQGIHQHFLKYQARGEPMPAVLCIGGPMCIAFVSKQKLPMGVSEYDVAGGLVGAPLRVTPARTVPLLVPADAEICVEGYISTDWLEPEGPFGESHGHVNPKEYNAYMDVTAITRRRQPVLMSIMSQMAPSEASVQRNVSASWLYREHLHRIGIVSARQVLFHEESGVTRYCVIQFEPGALDADVWRAMFACLSLSAGFPKIVIAVDTDIDPSNSNSVWWAMGLRSTPHRDIQIVHGMEPGHAPRQEQHVRGVASESAVLWDARLRGTFPPISLQREEFMVRAREIWEELGLPPLRPQAPWFGYSLGEWNDELDEEARLAVESEFFRTGEKIAGQRVSAREVPMNTGFYEPEPR